MATIHVSDTEALLAALKSATGGDTIVLADGDYGALNLKGRYGPNVLPYDSPVTITSATPGGARFDTVTIRDAQNLTFDQVTITGEFRASFSSNIAVTNSVGHALYFRDVAGATITGNHVSEGKYTLNLFSVSDFTITDNVFERAGADLIQISRNSYNGLIENNVLWDTVAATPDIHPDLIQIYGYDGMTPHDIIIRGNYLYDDPATGLIIAQGIFLSGPQETGFRNILIEDNLVSVRSPNTIYIDGGQENVFILNNSLIAGPEVFKGGVIRLTIKNGFDNSGVTVEGNLASSILDETKSSIIGDNYLYKGYQAAAELFQGAGGDWRDFLLRDPDGPAAGFGALDKLAELLAGEGITAPPEDLPGDLLAAFRLAGLRDLELSGNLVLPEHLAQRLDPVTAIAHDPALALSEATIAFGFNADRVDGNRALFSKDAEGIGHGLGAWISGGTLHIAFEDGRTTAMVRHDGIEAGTGHALQIAFGGGIGQVWLDGAMIGQVHTGIDWQQNTDALIVGADNSRSSAGTQDAMRWAFDGAISGFSVYDRSLSPTELADILGAEIPVSPGSGPALRLAGLRDLELSGNLVLPEHLAQRLDPVTAIAHDPALALSEATIAFGFNADRVDGNRALFSKDAEGIGHGLGAWISGGTLHIAFEDGRTTAMVRHDGIEAGTGHALQIAFGGGIGQVWLDGAMIGQVHTGIDWQQNTDALIVGADNSRSSAGTQDAMRWAFDGAISGFSVYDRSLSPTELADILGAEAHLLL